jgi:nucleotide-binding universal stress UspA family protein
MPGITVGVEGSGHSQRALEWAVKEAGCRKVPLTVLAVREVASDHWTGNPLTFPANQPEVEQTRLAAEQATQKAVDAADEPVAALVTVRAVNGIAAQELIKASAASDLVVVGSRGGGGFAKLMLGSVTSLVVAHAACPIVVIPADR